MTDTPSMFFVSRLPSSSFSPVYTSIPSSPSPLAVTMLPLPIYDSTVLSVMMIEAAPPNPAPPMPWDPLAIAMFPATDRMSASSSAARETFPSAVTPPNFLPSIYAFVVLVRSLTAADPAIAMPSLDAPREAATVLISLLSSAETMTSPPAVMSESCTEAAVSLSVVLTATEAPMPALPPKLAEPAIDQMAVSSPAEIFALPPESMSDREMKAWVSLSIWLTDTEPASPYPLSFLSSEPLAEIVRTVPSVSDETPRSPEISRNESVMEAFVSVSSSLYVTEPARPTDVPSEPAIAAAPAMELMVLSLRAERSTFSASTSFKPVMAACVLSVIRLTETSPATDMAALGFFSGCASPSSSSSLNSRGRDTPSSGSSSAILSGTGEVSSCDSSSFLLVVTAAASE